MKLLGELIIRRPLRASPGTAPSPIRARTPVNSVAEQPFKQSTHRLEVKGRQPGRELLDRLESNGLAHSWKLRRTGVRLNLVRRSLVAARNGARTRSAIERSLTRPRRKDELPPDASEVPPDASEVPTTHRMHGEREGGGPPSAPPPSNRTVGSTADGPPVEGRASGTGRRTVHPCAPPGGKPMETPRPSRGLSEYEGRRSEPSNFIPPHSPTRSGGA